MKSTELTKSSKSTELTKSKDDKIDLIGRIQKIDRIKKLDNIFQMDRFNQFFPHRLFQLWQNRPIFKINIMEYIFSNFTNHLEFIPD